MESAKIFVKMCEVPGFRKSDHKYQPCFCFHNFFLGEFDLLIFLLSAANHKHLFFFFTL